MKSQPTPGFARRSLLASLTLCFCVILCLSALSVTVTGSDAGYEQRTTAETHVPPAGSTSVSGPLYTLSHQQSHTTTQLSLRGAISSPQADRVLNRSREQAVLDRIQALIPVVERLRNASFGSQPPAVQFVSGERFNRTVQRTSLYQQTVSTSLRDSLFWEALLAPPSFTDALLPSHSAGNSSEQNTTPPQSPQATPSQPRSAPDRFILGATRPPDGVRYIASTNLLLVDRTQTPVSPLDDLSLVRELSRALQLRLQTDLESSAQLSVSTLRTQYTRHLVTDGVGALVSLAYAVECGRDLSELISPASESTALLDSAVGQLTSQSTLSDVSDCVLSLSSPPSLLSSSYDPRVLVASEQSAPPSQVFNPLAIHSQAGATGLWALAAHITSRGWANSSLLVGSTFPSATTLFDAVPREIPDSLFPDSPDPEISLGISPTVATGRSGSNPSSTPQSGSVIESGEQATLRRSTVPSFTDTSTDNWSQLRGGLTTSPTTSARPVGEGELFAGLWTGTAAVTSQTQSRALFSSPQNSPIPVHVTSPTRGLAGAVIHTYTRRLPTAPRSSFSSMNGAVLSSDWETETDAATFARAYIALLRAQNTTMLDPVTYDVSPSSPHAGTYRVIQYQTRVTIVFADTPAAVDTIRSEFHFGQPSPVAPQTIPQQSVLLNESEIFSSGQSQSDSAPDSGSSSTSLSTSLLLGIVILLLIVAVSGTWLLIRNR